MNLFFTLLVGLFMQYQSNKNQGKVVEKDKNEGVQMKKTENKVSEFLKDKIYQNINSGLYIKSLGNLTSNTFSVAPDGTGVQVKQLGRFILKWEHFDAIIKKANELGGIMYRGDVLPQVGGVVLGRDVSHDCMEGFIARVLLGRSDGTAITRRSTYYSGILAWAGIVELNKSEGKGSYITVNSIFRNV